MKQIFFTLIHYPRHFCIFQSFYRDNKHITYNVKIIIREFMILNHLLSTPTCPAGLHMTFRKLSQSNTNIQKYIILRNKAIMFKQISAKDTNISKAVKKSPAESMVVNLVSMESHSNSNVVVKIEMATDSDIHLKNSAQIKINTSRVHGKLKRINTAKITYTMKISSNRSQSMLSAVAVRIPYSIASNTSPRQHRITKIRLVFGCSSRHSSKKNLIKRNVKSQIRQSQPHPQSLIFKILTNKVCRHSIIHLNIFLKLIAHVR